LKRLALLLLLGLAQPVAAQERPAACPQSPATFPFAPPSAPLRFTIETERPVSSGGMRRFGLEYRIRFHAVGSGHGLTATLLRIDTPDAMAAGSAMAAIFAPLVGRPLEFFYDANANQLFLRKAEADALWNLLADEMVTRARSAKPGEARGVAAMLLDLPVGQREQMLFADLGQMLRFVGRGPGADLSVSTGDSADGCRVVKLTGNAGWIHGGPGLYTNTIWLVDRHSGLVNEQREDVSQRHDGDEKLHLAARTIRRLTPE
jgi:hypothetical protein